MSKISRFIKKVATLAKNAVGERGEVAAPEGGGGFADYALVSLYCLQIYPDASYRNALDLLSDMPHILTEIGLEEGDLTDHSTLVKAFERFQIKVWRVQLHPGRRLAFRLDRAGRLEVAVTRPGLSAVIQSMYIMASP
jgi:IS5 family transposase